MTIEQLLNLSFAIRVYMDLKVDIDSLKTAASDDEIESKVKQFSYRYRLDEEMSFLKELQKDTVAKMEEKLKEAAQELKEAGIEL